MLLLHDIIKGRGHRSDLAVVSLLHSRNQIFEGDTATFWQSCLRGDHGKINRQSNFIIANVLCTIYVLKYFLANCENLRSSAKGPPCCPALCSCFHHQVGRMFKPSFVYSLEKCFDASIITRWYHLKPSCSMRMIDRLQALWETLGLSWKSYNKARCLFVWEAYMPYTIPSMYFVFLCVTHASDVCNAAKST